MAAEGKLENVVHPASMLAISGFVNVLHACQEDIKSCMKSVSDLDELSQLVCGAGEHISQSKWKGSKRTERHIGFAGGHPTHYW